MNYLSKVDIVYNLSENNLFKQNLRKNALIAQNPKCRAHNIERRLNSFAFFVNS